MKIATGLLLLIVPIGLNAAFIILMRTFDYPAVLRRPSFAAIVNAVSYIAWSA